MNRDVCEHFNPVDLPCEKCKSASVQKSTQFEALRLANALQQQAVWEGHYGPSYLRDLLPEAAAELRRLHAQRDALLDALKEIVAAADGTGWDQLDASFSKARAAIAKAEEKA